MSGLSSSSFPGINPYNSSSEYDHMQIEGKSSLSYLPVTEQDQSYSSQNEQDDEMQIEEEEGGGNKLSSAEDDDDDGFGCRVETTEEKCVRVQKGSEKALFPKLEYVTIVTKKTYINGEEESVEEEKTTIAAESITIVIEDKEREAIQKIFTEMKKREVKEEKVMRASLFGPPEVKNPWLASVYLDKTKQKEAEKLLEVEPYEGKCDKDPLKRMSDSKQALRDDGNFKCPHLIKNEF